MKGKIYVVGIGPGNRDNMTPYAVRAVSESDVIVGYKLYVGLIMELCAGKEIISNGMHQEVDRCKAAVDAAVSGKTVSVISSGDAGIYGMAGLVFDIIREGKLEIGIEVVPGITALSSSAAMLGAPLMNDFAAVSLSDLLTPRELILKRIRGACEGDFVICLYNPSSHKRKELLPEIISIVSEYRGADTPAGITRNNYREGSGKVITTLGRIMENEIDMLTTIIIGNSMTYRFMDYMVTGRGYKI